MNYDKKTFLEWLRYRQFYFKLDKNKKEDLWNKIDNMIKQDLQ